MKAVGDRVQTPDGAGTVQAIEKHVDVMTPFVRYGVKHDIFPPHRPRVYKDDILFYMDYEVKEPV